MLLGIVIGWQIGDNIGVSQLPPNAWAGDGIGLMIWDFRGAFWGAVIGFGVGLVCCLLWHFLVQRRTPAIVSGVVPEDGEVWPPAPLIPGEPE